MFITEVGSHFTKRSRRRGHRDFLLIGEKNDVHVAKLTMNFMFKAFERFWKIYKGQHSTNIRRMTEIMKDSYSKGFAAGLNTKFKEQVESKELIVLQDKAVGEYIEKEYPKTTKQYRYGHSLRDYNAFEKGFKDGRA